MSILSVKNRKEKNEHKEHVNEKTFVIMYIDDNMFGIDVDCINSVNGMISIREIPYSKPYMKGVINLRDVIVPVVDLRIKFKSDISNKRDKPVILITLMQGKYIGMIVDMVQDVVTVAESEIQQTVYYCDGVGQDCIEGICTLNGETIVLLNTEKVLSEDDFIEMEELNIT